MHLSHVIDCNHGRHSRVVFLHAGHRARTALPTLRRNLAVSTGEAGAYGAMVGLGETYFPAFALALGMGEVTAGIVASAPMMVGGVLQLISPWAIARVGSYKHWIIISAALQALSLVPWSRQLGSAVYRP